MHVAQQAAERRARRRVKQKLGLLVHWLVHLAVNAGLLIASGGFAGSGWRIAGWGLGLAAHTAYVAVGLGCLQERLVQRELDREGAR